MHGLVHPSLQVIVAGRPAKRRERENPLFPSIQSTDDVSHHSDRTDQSCKRWAGPAPIHPPRHPLTHLMYNFFSSSPPAQFSFSRCIRHKKNMIWANVTKERETLFRTFGEKILKKKPYLSFLNKTHECCNILFLYTDTIIRRMSSQRERGWSVILNMIKIHLSLSLVYSFCCWGWDHLWSDKRGLFTDGARFSPNTT